MWEDLAVLIVHFCVRNQYGGVKMAPMPRVGGMAHLRNLDKRANCFERAPLFGKIRVFAKVGRGVDSMRYQTERLTNETRGAPQSERSEAVIVEQPVMASESPGFWDRLQAAWCGLLGGYTEAEYANDGFARVLVQDRGFSSTVFSRLNHTAEEFIKEHVGLEYVDTKPSVENTISILRGLRQRYELQHAVRISDGTMVEAAILAARYITGLFFFEGVLDVVHKADAKLKIQITSKPTGLDETDRAILKLEMEQLSLDKVTDERLQDGFDEILAYLKLCRDRRRKLEEKWWEEQNSFLTGIHSFKEKVDRMSLEMQQVKRDYHLSRAIELKYGNFITLQKLAELTEQAMGCLIPFQKEMERGEEEMVEYRNMAKYTREKVEQAMVEFRKARRSGGQAVSTPTKQKEGR